MKPSINTLTCNCQNKEACPLNGQCQIEEVASENTLSSNQPNYKKKGILGLRKSLSRGAYTTRIYLSEMNFTETIQSFLRKSGKSK